MDYLQVKICGLTTADAVAAAIEEGADYLGFIFHTPSPRHVPFSVAEELATLAPGGVQKVGVTVDADERTLEQIMQSLRPQYLQLHGHESPDDVVRIRHLFGVPVIKAIPVATAEDVALARAFEGVADMLLFDTKSSDPKQAGGTGRIFDWSLLAGQEFTTPWFLSGGLSAENIVEAIRVTGAQRVDVSSSLESSRGVKSPEKIRHLMHLLEPYRP